MSRCTYLSAFCSFTTVLATAPAWEQHFGDVPFRVDIPSDSPFIDYELVAAASIDPAFEPLNPGETSILPIKLIKGDFSGLVTTQPQPGDIVIAYMTGLGPARPGTDRNISGRISNACGC